MVCKMGCASARTGTHAGTATVPRTVATLTGCPVRVSQYCRTKKARQKALLSLLERITRLARCASARTGTHAGTATVPRTVATLTGCPVRVLQYCRTKKARQKALLFYWSGLRDSNSLPPPWQGGALPDELNPQIWCFRTESNHRHEDFQSSALPTELQKHKWRPGTGSNRRPPA